MPVARLTNVANWDDLLGEIRTFLNTTGDWTIHEDLRTPTEGALAGGRELVVSNGDVLAGLRSTTSGSGANRMLLFDGIPPYGSSVDLDSLPNNSGVVMTSANYESSSAPPCKGESTQFAGPFPTAFIFTDDPSTYCHVVVEVIAGRFRHIWFGNMRKFGTWVGGAYYAATRWNSGNTAIDSPGSPDHITPIDGATPSTSALPTIYADNGVDSLWRTSNGVSLNSVLRGAARGSVRGGFGHTFRNLQETPFSGLIALQPVTIQWIRTGDSPSTTRFIGQIKDVAEVNIGNLFPGESYFIGSDEWIVFPLAQKRLPSERLDIENSGYYGMAYKVIP